MAKIELMYRILIHDKKGKLVHKSKWKESDSFTIAFLEHIYGAFASTSVNMEDTSGVQRNIVRPAQCTSYRPIVNAPNDEDAYGIVVGTGTTPPTNEDYALETQIVQGLGAGQLDYGAHSFTAPAVVVGNVDMIVSRSFYNGSGAKVTIREIGIYGHSASTPCTTYYDLCLVRDVLPAGLDVLDTQTLTVQYTLRTTV